MNQETNLPIYVLATCILFLIAISLYLYFLYRRLNRALAYTPLPESPSSQANTQTQQRIYTLLAYPNFISPKIELCAHAQSAASLAKDIRDNQLNSVLLMGAPYNIALVPTSSEPPLQCYPACQATSPASPDSTSLPYTFFRLTPVLNSQYGLQNPTIFENKWAVFHLLAGATTYQAIPQSQTSNNAEESQKSIMNVATRTI